MCACVTKRHEALAGAHMLMVLFPFGDKTSIDCVGSIKARIDLSTTIHVEIVGKRGLPFVASPLHGLPPLDKRFVVGFRN